MEYADAEIIMDRAYEELFWQCKPDHGLSLYGFIALCQALMAVGVPDLEASDHITRWELEHFDPVKLKIVRYWIHRQYQEARGDELTRMTRILARSQQNRGCKPKPPKILSRSLWALDATERQLSSSTCARLRRGPSALTVLPRCFRWAGRGVSGNKC